MRQLIAGLFASVDGFACGRDPDGMDGAMADEAPRPTSGSPTCSATSAWS